MLWKVLLDNFVKLCWRIHMHNVRSKSACAMFTLGVTAGELPHEQSAFIGSKPIDDHSVMLQHTFTLLIQRRIGRNG